MLGWVNCPDTVFDASSLISMLLHELFADADLLNEFPGSSILVTVRRKVVAFMPDSRLPNITLEVSGKLWILQVFSYNSRSIIYSNFISFMDID